MATSVAPRKPVPGGGPRSAEASLHLDLNPPRTLGLVDQLSLWGNLGVSLLGPVTAVFVLAPLGTPMSLAAAFTALLIGVVAGAGILGLAAVPGARTGAPAMVMMRGLLGRRGSVAPTVLNILQNVGWATFEVVVIAEAASRLTSDGLRPLWVVLAGALATTMAVRPLGSVRALRKVVVWLVLAASVYLLVSLLQEPLPAFTDGGWDGFMAAVDVALVAGGVSYAPLAADYSRHSRTGGAAFTGAFVGFGAAAFFYLTLGILAFATIVDLDGDVIAALLAVPAGAVALFVLAVDEVDEAYANVYSTTMSVQNVAPQVDRRWVSVTIGAVATVLALVVDIAGYQNFLYLIGSVFVPLLAVLIVDFFVVSRGDWDLSVGARTRVVPIVAWALGFVTYQLINPGYLEEWARPWVELRAAVGFTPPGWLGASFTSFAVAASVMGVVGSIVRRSSAATERSNVPGQG
jgi:putative hydroxymethylpyrimidine transporter CytX